MAGQLLIYGAYGFTGRLTVSAALQRGLAPILAGRDAAKLAQLARETGLERRVVELHDASALDAALRGVSVVLLAAGPFSATSRPMVEACLRTGTHYLDVSGEVPVVETLRRLDPEARERAIMILPAVGFDVVASDCLGAHVARRLGGATHLALGIRGLELLTPGSARSLVEHAREPSRVRRDGDIVTLAPGALRRDFDYGDGPRRSVNVTWGDVATSFHTTGIPNTEVYLEESAYLNAAMLASRWAGALLGSAPAQAWLSACAGLLPEGPSAEQRSRRRMTLVAEARDPRGGVALARLHTPEAFEFSGTSAAAIAGFALGGDVEIGFQTPARVYGPDFVLGFAGASREDL
jgi:short subunit dehydrogenase-like uncharacterized protein